MHCSQLEELKPNKRNPWTNDVIVQRMAWNLLFNHNDRTVDLCKPSIKNRVIAVIKEEIPSHPLNNHVICLWISLIRHHFILVKLVLVL